MDRFDLTGRIAIITGGGTGIGRSTALVLAEHGADLVLAARRIEPLESTAREVEALGRRALVTPTDVVDASACQRLVEATMDNFGRVDILVNNAGITQDARLQKMTDEQFDRVIDVNLKGVYNCAKAVLDTMIEQGGGVILNASSVVGIYGNYGQTNYAASKFGVIGFVKTWAREVGPKGIRCNAVAPGFINTPILDSIPDDVMRKLTDRVPLKRLGRPEEVANVYAFLASDEASYINGAVIEVSGGVTI